ncbi:MAG TPA: PH domain-containing protein [Syntrophobacteria bacterium]|nr:PH domain-containing protein [Syntrophobacteria bacterium]
MARTMMRRDFRVAPWPRTLKIISALGTALLVVVGIAAYRAIPAASGFAHAFGLAIALIFPAILIGSLLFMVTGYSVEGSTLFVERRFFPTKIPLEGLRRVFSDPAVCKGSIRLIGNAGLFSFTGLYQSKALGRYRLFATDFSYSVVIVLAKGVVVITPSSPAAFIEHLRQAFPSVQVGPNGY